MGVLDRIKGMDMLDLQTLNGGCFTPSCSVCLDDDVEFIDQNMLLMLRYLISDLPINASCRLLKDPKY